MASPLPQSIANHISIWPLQARKRFDEIREIVIDVANRVDVGELSETLKWGQPAWLPSTPRQGTTLRCNWSAKRPEDLSLFVHCQTTLAETVRELYPDAFVFEGRRALHFTLDQPLPQQAVAHCAQLALTYHRKTA